MSAIVTIILATLLAAAGVAVSSASASATVARIGRYAVLIGLVVIVGSVYSTVL